jgi:CsoR family transcriptional regulator, copper-sensing transcriptional repressor
MTGYAMRKDDLQGRLRRIEGQIRGIQKMVDEDTYCIDILTQLNAVSAAVKKVGIGLLDGHVRTCVRESLESHGPDGDAKVDELVAAVARFSSR